MDTYKVTSKLTLIAGLRYDFFERWVNRGAVSRLSIPPGLGDGAPVPGRKNLRCPQANLGLVSRLRGPQFG